MRKRLFSIFWITNSIIMIMHLVNYFFNQGQGNYFETLAIVLYRDVLPYFNILITLVCVGTLLIKSYQKIRFVFEKEFKYMFFFLLISISTSATKTITDTNFIFYMSTVALFALALSFLPIENTAIK